jgi:hypothetical protein
VKQIRVGRSVLGHRSSDLEAPGATRFIGVATPARRAARFIGVARPMRRARGPAIVGHRRLWPSVVFHRFELIAWVGIVAVLGVTAVFTARAVAAGQIAASLSARFQPPAPAPYTSTDTTCVVNNCSRPPLIGPPTRLRIGALGVDSALEDLSLDVSGKLAAPRSYDLAGWFAGGVLPGDPGPAVIAGHVDSAKGPAVFYRLNELGPGDTVEVLRGDTWVTFRVTDTEQYPKDQFPSERVYRPTPGAELRLITCGGDFDPGRLSYRDNLVVYAVIA